jgi:hypothetical protein
MIIRFSIIESIMKHFTKLVLPFVNLLLARKYIHSCINLIITVTALVTTFFVNPFGGVSLYILAIAHALVVIHIYKKRQMITTIGFIARKLNEQ